MKTFRRTCLFAVLALLVSGPTFGAIHTNTIRGTSFNPRDMSITVGDTVVWINVKDHSVSGSGAEPFCGPQVFTNVSDTCVVTFNTPGSYYYFCGPHYFFWDMNGTVTVNPVFK